LACFPHAEPWKPAQVVDFKDGLPKFTVSVDNFVDRCPAPAREARKIKGLAGLPAKTAWTQHSKINDLAVLAEL
jgi:hypothetical protein